MRASSSLHLGVKITALNRPGGREICQLAGLLELDKWHRPWSETAPYFLPLSYGGVHTRGTFRNVRFWRRADSPLNLGDEQFPKRLTTPLLENVVCFETFLGGK